MIDFCAAPVSIHFLRLSERHDAAECAGYFALTAKASRVPWYVTHAAKDRSVGRARKGRSPPKGRRGISNKGAVIDGALCLTDHDARA